MGEQLPSNQEGVAIEKQEDQEDFVIVHISDLEKLYRVKGSLEGSLVQNSHGVSGGGSQERLRRVEEILNELEQELTKGMGFEIIMNNAQRRYRRSGANVYFTRQEDFQDQGKVIQEEINNEINQLKSRGVKTLSVNPVAHMLFLTAKDIANEMNIELVTGIERLSEADFPLAIYDILDKNGNMVVYDKLEDVPEKICRGSDVHYSKK